MYLTDPTYIRTIQDGLLSGAVNKDNASALPLGLVGMYEEALPPASHVKERQKILEFFSVWALLKKDVSAAFVSQLLGWTEERVLDYIALYSKWFNAPLTGKYVLYHERFRSFVLQKISHTQFAACTEAIIKLGQEALQSRIGHEWEQYALEHLSTHLLIHAMESKDATALKMLAYSTIHWNRQVEISNGFEWSKHMLNDMMLWASLHDDDELIECTLNKVDLDHLEQNDAPRIVELIAQNDLDIALQRIEAYGGNDKEGLQKKFILYMLCLMELSLLESKDKSFRKAAIEKLLNHLDEQLPLDQSILNWNDFFPSYLVFQMACEWAALGQHYWIVYKRTDDWGKDWIKEKGPYTDLQFEVLFECARGISSNDYDKSSALKEISAELAKQVKTEEAASAMQEALTCARGISNDYLKSCVLKDISADLAKEGKTEEALACARGIGNDYLKIIALKDISAELTKQVKTEEAASAMQESLTCARGISGEDAKSYALKDISAELAKQGRTEEALACARGISSDDYKSYALKDISAELAKQVKTEEAQAS
jgi:hypothetical protein